MNDTIIRVILADDHEVFRDGIRLLFNRQKNIELVGEAEDGEQLVSLATKLKPDVILTDIQMPVMNGIEATRILTEKLPGTPIIALSMSNQEDALQGMMEAGAKGFLVKSATKAEMVLAIRTVYDQNYFYCRDTSNKLSTAFYKKEQAVEKAAQFNDRELEIIQLICKGLNFTEISEKMFLSPRTVEGYKYKIMEKLGVQTIAGIVVWAIKHNVFQP